MVSCPLIYGEQRKICFETTCGIETRHRDLKQERFNYGAGASFWDVALLYSLLTHHSPLLTLFDYSFTSTVYLKTQFA